jgi:integrase
MPQLDINKTQVAKLPDLEPGKRVDYNDRTLPGFVLRWTGKSGMYYARKRDPLTHKLIWLKIGSTSLLSPQVARDDAQKKLANIHVAVEKDRKTITGADLVARYLKEHASTLSSDKNDRILLTKWFLPKFGTMAITRVTRVELNTLLHHIGGELGLKTTAYHVKSRIRKMFNWAFDKDLITASPVVRLTSDYKPGEGRLVLTPEEIARVWFALEHDRRTWARCCARLLMLTGQRRKEVVGTPWTEVDFNRRMWIIDASRTKNNLTQTVPLCDMALKQFQIMHDLTCHTTHVFWAEPKGRKLVAGPMAVTQVSRIPPDLRRAKATKEIMAPIREFVVHNFRHTVASNVGRLTESRDAVKHVLNHKEAGATPLYDEHTYDGTKRNAFQLWEADIAATLVRFKHLNT